MSRGASTPISSVQVMSEGDFFGPIGGALEPGAADALPPSTFAGLPPSPRLSAGRPESLSRGVTPSQGLPSSASSSEADLHRRGAGSMQAASLVAPSAAEALVHAPVDWAPLGSADEIGVSDWSLLESPGAVGELHVQVLHATGLVLERQNRLASSLTPSLAASIYVSLAVGEGHELRGEPISYSGLRHVPSKARGDASGEDAHLDVGQRFRLAVHDSLTQRLRLRALVKELGKDLSELGAAEISLSDLRVGATATKKVVLPLAGRPSPALFHLQVTYRLLASARGGEGAGL